MIVIVFFLIVVYVVFIIQIIYGFTKVKTFQFTKNEFGNWISQNAISNYQELLNNLKFKCYVLYSHLICMHTTFIKIVLY